MPRKYNIVAKGNKARKKERKKQSGHDNNLLFLKVKLTETNIKH